MRLEKKQIVVIIALLAVAVLVFFALGRARAPLVENQPPPQGGVQSEPGTVAASPVLIPPANAPPPSPAVNEPTSSPPPASPEPISPTPKPKPTPPPQITPTEASEAEMPLSEADAVIPASPGSETMLRIFSVSMTKDGFQPETIVVNRGDTVQFKITAVHGSYDVFFPYLEYHSVIGEGKTLDFSFDVPENGKFDFSCRDRCPGGKTIKGEVIVLQL